MAQCLYFFSYTNFFMEDHFYHIPKKYYKKYIHLLNIFFFERKSSIYFFLSKQNKKNVFDIHFFGRRFFKQFNLMAYSAPIPCIPFFTFVVMKLLRLPLRNQFCTHTTHSLRLLLFQTEERRLLPLLCSFPMHELSPPYIQTHFSSPRSLMSLLRLICDLRRYLTVYSNPTSHIFFFPIL